MNLMATRDKQLMFRKTPQRRHHANWATRATGRPPHLSLAFSLALFLLPKPLSLEVPSLLQQSTRSVCFR